MYIFRRLRRYYYFISFLIFVSVTLNLLTIFKQYFSFDINIEIERSHDKYAQAFVNLKDFEYFDTASNKTVVANNGCIFHPIEIRLSNLEVNRNSDTESKVKHLTFGTLKKIFDNEINRRNKMLEIENSQMNAILEDCKYDVESSWLKGNITVENPPSSFDIFSFDKQYFLSSNITIGGAWSPSNCKPTGLVVIVVPIKDRLNHMKQFLYHMHPFLQRQMVSYRLFMAEQVNNGIFNKGVLMNAAYLEILNLGISFDCIIFHDVDLLPLDDRNFYTCPSTIKHLGVAINTFNYMLFYEHLIGGVLNFRREYYVKVNGYSNRFWGWGGEDDDMTERVLFEKIRWTRANISYAHYKMLKHEGRVVNSERFSLLKSTIKDYKTDGLNTVKYRLNGLINYKLFTHLLIDVGTPT